MEERERETARKGIEKALQRVERCKGNCKSCTHCKFDFADVPRGIVYAISCDAAGRWGAYCEDFDTMRAETLNALQDSLQEL